jgi:hypothetical protein
MILPRSEPLARERITDRQPEKPDPDDQHEDIQHRSDSSVTLGPLAGVAGTRLAIRKDGRTERKRAMLDRRPAVKM